MKRRAGPAFEAAGASPVDAAGASLADAAGPPEATDPDGVIGDEARSAAVAASGKLMDATTQIQALLDAGGLTSPPVLRRTLQLLQDAQRCLENGARADDAAGAFTRIW